MVTRLVDSHRSLQVPFPFVLANQERLQWEAGLFPIAMLWTIPHRPKFRTPVVQEALWRIRWVYFEELPLQNSK